MSECGCVYSGYDGDSAEFSTSRIVKARKPHTCCECGDPINVGMRHEVVAGKWDGEISSYRTCEPCVEIRKLLFCEGWNFTAVWEDIREYFREGGSPMGCIKKLDSVAAKEKLAARYRDYLGVAPHGAGTEER